MVTTQLQGRDITNKSILDVFKKVPRHLFVPENLKKFAYDDRALPIGEKQTISQPYVVALMTQAIKPSKSDKVLEIGTGSGYQAAILSKLVSEVYTIEIVEVLAKRAEKTLSNLQYKNVKVKCGDGFWGWEEHAPFDKIIVTCAPDKTPPRLLEQLKVGGVLILPRGTYPKQNLIQIEKKSTSEIIEKNLGPVLFVPMTGESQKK
jgi:protein-L-isoaspartate(D-aspartate) O-methyltransferase